MIEAREIEKVIAACFPNFDRTRDLNQQFSSIEFAEIILACEREFGRSINVALLDFSELRSCADLARSLG